MSRCATSSSNVVVEGDVPPAQHLRHECLDVAIGERRQGNVLEVIDEIHQPEGVERAGQIDRAADQPADRVPCRCRILSLGAKPGEEFTQQRFIFPGQVEQHVGKFVDDEQHGDTGIASLGQKRVAVLAPVLAPVGIAPTQRKLEATGSDLVDPSQHVADKSPACGKPLTHEIGMRIMESIEQHLEEVGRMGQVLNVDRHDREPVLGMIAQVVHNAGLAGAARCREHQMSGAQRLPQLRHERPAESQIDRVDGGAGVELRGVFRFHGDWVVKQMRCRNNYTTILMYVKCVVEMQRGHVPIRAAAGCLRARHFCRRADFREMQ